MKKLLLAAFAALVAASFLARAALADALLRPASELAEGLSRSGSDRT